MFIPFLSDLSSMPYYTWAGSCSNPGLKFCSVFVFYIPMSLLCIAKGNILCYHYFISWKRLNSTVFCNLELHVLKRENRA